MRLLSVVAAIALLFVLLTSLVLRATDTDAAGYAVTLQAFDEYSLQEASLRRDVLQARAGLNRNYDSLAKALKAMGNAIATLRTHAKDRDINLAPINRLTEMAAQQEALTERFKSSNALLQNSLIYVGLLSTSPAFGALDAEVAPVAHALVAAILHLASDTSPESVQAVQERINQFAHQLPRSGPHAEAAVALLAHSRLLHTLLPSVDQTLKQLLAVPSHEPLEAVRALFSEHHEAVEASAQRFRLLLYLVSLLLLVTLTYLGMRMRTRALDLRRRAAFERVVAETSTRLVNFPPAETQGRLREVLREVTRATKMERGYVVLNETPVRVHSWCTEQTTYPPGWPENTLALSAMLRKPGHEIIALSDVDVLPKSKCRNMLKAAGVRAWTCVPLFRSGREIGVLGFDAPNPVGKRDGVYPISVMRLFADAVAGAIERDHLERERVRLATRLERSRRMQMIGSLTSGIAHNFNNIIGAILGYSEMAEAQFAPGTKPAQHIDEIRKAAERARDLIDGMLAFGRRRDAGIRPVHVRTLFEEAASLLHALLPASIEVTIEDVPAEVAVPGEPAQLQQIILNLCTNASQAMNGQGQIRIAAQLHEITARRGLSHGELTPGLYVCIAVRDTGRGFDEDMARQLFEPFFTTRPDGTGLGLATVREIVRDHDGAMNVQSKLGHGSRFDVWLPAVSAANTGVVAPFVMPLGRGETVLVLDCDRGRLLRAEETLAALGYEPAGFERLADAIAACHSEPHRFDIILVNHASQVQDGLDMARALHEIMPSCALLLGTYTNDVSAEAVAQAGISEVVSLPLVGTELAGALARALNVTNVTQFPSAETLL